MLAYTCTGDVMQAPDLCWTTHPRENGAMLCAFLLSDAISEASSIEVGLVVMLCGVVFAAGTMLAVQRSKIGTIGDHSKRNEEDIDSLRARIGDLEKWKEAKVNQDIGRKKERRRQQHPANVSESMTETGMWPNDDSS